MKVVKCKFCGAPIVWIKTQNGRSMPCDANAVQYANTHGGKDVVVTAEGKVVRVSVIKGGGVLTLIPDGEGYISHFATCTHANEARKPKAADSTTTTPPERKPAPTYPDPDAGDYYADLCEAAEAASKERRKW